MKRNFVKVNDNIARLTEEEAKGLNVGDVTEFDGNQRTVEDMGKFYGIITVKFEEEKKLNAFEQDLKELLVKHGYDQKMAKLKGGFDSQFNALCFAIETIVNRKTPDLEDIIEMIIERHFGR